MSGERSKLVGHQTVTYTLALRAVASWSSKRVVNEDVYRVYEDATGYARRVVLGARSQCSGSRAGDGGFERLLPGQRSGGSCDMPHFSSRAATGAPKITTTRRTRWWVTT